MSRGDLRGGAGVVAASSANATTLAGVTPTAAGLALLGDADAAAQRVSLGLVIGTNVPSLNGSAKVVEDPANATVTPTASKIPIADGSGKLDSWISSASTSTAGVVQLATSGEAAAGKAVTGTDARLSDTRTPSAHATSHAPGGSDALALLPLLLVAYFGSGRDGALVFDGSSSVTIAGVSHAPSGGVYTLTRGVEASAITMSGCTIAAAGFPIRCSGTWTCTGTNVIHDDGNAASGSTAGSFLGNTGNPLARTSTSGGNGAVGLNNGSAGSNYSNTGSGGAGGTGGNSPSRSGGSGGTSTTSQLSQSWYGHEATVMGVGYRNNSGTLQLLGLECGAGGGGGASELAGIAGGGGGGGGLVAVWCYNLVISSGTLTFRARGGAGANAGAGNAGGGGGGGGGMVQVITYTYTGSPTLSAAGGAKGLKAGTGSDGNDGNAGHTRLAGNGTLTET